MENCKSTTEQKHEGRPKPVVLSDAESHALVTLLVICYLCIFGLVSSLDGGKFWKGVAVGVALPAVCWSAFKLTVWIWSLYL